MEGLMEYTHAWSIYVPCRAVAWVLEGRRWGVRVVLARSREPTFRFI